MSREEYISSLITGKGFTIKSFATLIDMPYTTLRSILGENGSFGKTSIENASKIAKGLNVTIEDLWYGYNNIPNAITGLTPKETKLLNNYKNLNSTGKSKIEDLADDLSQIPKYSKSNFDEEQSFNVVDDMVNITNSVTEMVNNQSKTKT